MNESFLIAEIAKLYYINQLKQNQIAELFNLSPMQVSRYLKIAVDEGVVRFSIQTSWKTDVGLGKKIAEKFNLVDCVVIDDTTGDQRNNMAYYLAHYISSTIKKGDILGLSWGRTINEFVEALPYINLENIRIVQLAGGVVTDSSYMFTSSFLITRLCARFKESIPIYLNAPFYLPDQDTKDKLLQDKGIQQVFSLAQKANFNIIGCSAFDENMAMIKLGLVSHYDVKELRGKKAIGEVGGYFIDEGGELIDWSKANLYSGLSLEQIGKANCTICTAFEESKHPTLKAILPKKIFNVLFITQKVAQLLLSS